MLLFQEVRKLMENSNLIKQTYNKCLLFSMLMIIPGSLGAIVDSVFIGSLIGADGTAAYGLVMPITLIVSALSMLLGNGGITLYLTTSARAKSSWPGRISR